MDLVSAIYYAAQGDNGLKEYGMRGAKGGKNKGSTLPKSKFQDKFRFYFPSHDTVVKSRGGKNVRTALKDLIKEQLINSRLGSGNHLRKFQMVGCSYIPSRTSSRF